MKKIFFGLKVKFMILKSRAKEMLEYLSVTQVIEEMDGENRGFE